MYCGARVGAVSDERGTPVRHRSYRDALSLFCEIQNISLFHRDRKSADESAEEKVWLVGVGPAQKAWMSGTGKEEVKPEERWQRCSDQAREILAAMQRQRPEW